MYDDGSSIAALNCENGVAPEATGARGAQRAREEADIFDVSIYTKNFPKILSIFFINIIKNSEAKFASFDSIVEYP
jgi:hypothetical protein